MCLLTLKPVSWAHTSLLNVPSHQAQQGEQSIGVLSPKEQRPPPYASLRTFGSPDSVPRPITMSHCAVDSRGCPALGPPVLVSAPSLCRVLPLTGHCGRRRALTPSPVQPVHPPLLHHQQHASTVASPSTPSGATLTLRVHTPHSLPSRHPCLEAGPVLLYARDRFTCLHLCLGCSFYLDAPSVCPGELPVPSPAHPHLLP